MIDKTTPATNGERVKTGTFISKAGMNPRYLCNNFDQYSTLGINTKKPQIPKRMDGKAAITSMIVTIIFLSQPGA